MRVFFVFSATVWSWIVGRCIAFGVGFRGCTWMPDITADSWYRLTRIPYPIPHKWFELIPIFLALAFIPTLIIDNDIIHIIAVLSLVLQHAFLPLFVAQVHSQTLLSSWACACCLFSLALWTFLCTSMTSTLFIIAFIFQCLVLVLILWLTSIQLYVTCARNIVHQPPEETPRVPRTV